MQIRLCCIHMTIIIILLYIVILIIKDHKQRINRNIKAVDGTLSHQRTDSKVAKVTVNLREIVMDLM